MSFGSINDTSTRNLARDLIDEGKRICANKGSAILHRGRATEDACSAMMKFKQYRSYTERSTFLQREKKD